MPTFAARPIKVISRDEFDLKREAREAARGLLAPDPGDFNILMLALETARTQLDIEEARSNDGSGPRL